MTRRMNLIKDFSNVLNINDLSREWAIVIYKGKLYKDFNHQSALEKALNSEGKTLELNLDNSELLLAEEITNSFRSEDIITTWNWYYNDETEVEYLIASDLDNYIKDSGNKELTDLNLKLGYFETSSNIILK